MNYLFCGNESFLLKKQLNKLIFQFVSEDQIDLNVSYLDCKETPLSIIIDELNTIPFLSDKKVVVLKNPLFLSSETDKNSFNNDYEELVKYLENSNESTILVIYLEGKVDERKKIVKNVKKLCEIIELNQLDEVKFRQATYNAIIKRGAKINNDALELLLQRAPSDLTTISNEVDKLTLYTKDITINDVREMISKPKEDKFFELGSAILKKNLVDALQIYKDLMVNNQEPVALVGSIANQIRLVYQVKILERKGYNNQEMASKMGISPFRIRYIIEDAARFEINELLRHLDSLSKLDIGIKSGVIDKRLGLELYLINM